LKLVSAVCLPCLLMLRISVRSTAGSLFFALLSIVTRFRGVSCSQRLPCRVRQATENTLRSSAAYLVWHSPSGKLALQGLSMSRAAECVTNWVVIDQMAQSVDGSVQKVVQHVLGWANVSWMHLRLLDCRSLHLDLGWL